MTTKTKQVTTHGDLKSVMLTLRITEPQEEEIEIARRVIETNKEMGASEVTRSETVHILIKMGLVMFGEKYADQIRKMVKETKGSKKKSA